MPLSSEESLASLELMLQLLLLLLPMRLGAITNGLGVLDVHLPCRSRRAKMVLVPPPLLLLLSSDRLGPIAVVNVRLRRRPRRAEIKSGDERHTSLFTAC